MPTCGCRYDGAGLGVYAGVCCVRVILRLYLATGPAAVGRAGEATSELIDGADVVRFAVRWMAEHLTGA